MKIFFLLLLVLSGCGRVAQVSKEDIPHSPSDQGELPSLGGTDIGGGGDSKPQAEHLHWFPGGQKAKYCIETNPEFPWTHDHLEKLVEGAQNKWERYLRIKMLPVSQLSIKWTRTECSKASVHFVFGQQSPVMNAVSARYRDPVAFAHKVKETGYVWFSGVPREDLDWQNEEFLSTLLLHEVGHIYGNPHVPGTVMDREIVSIARNLTTPWMGRIDFSQELAHCGPCLQTLRTLPSADSPKSRETFRQLMGRYPEEGLHLKFVSPDPLSVVTAYPIFSITPLGTIASLPALQTKTQLQLNDLRGSALWEGDVSENYLELFNSTKVFEWEYNGNSGSSTGGTTDFIFSLGNSQREVIQIIVDPVAPEGLPDGVIRLIYSEPFGETEIGRVFPLEK